jgi:hypothetical protein
MKKCKSLEIIEKIASEYGIKITQSLTITNDSYLCGSSEIILGKYRDQEKELISFFHELGHILIDKKFIKKWNYNTLIIEIECWNRGIEEARKKGILFSDKAMEWGYKKALSYIGHDEREYSNWKETHAINLWINKGL